MILKQYEGNGIHSQTRQTHTGNIDGSYAPRHTPLVNFTIILCEAKMLQHFGFQVCWCINNLAAALWHV